MTYLLENERNRYLFLALSVLLVLLMRFLLFDYQSVDYRSHLSIWISTIKANGGLVSLKDAFYNYTPMYMYLMTFMSKFDIPNIYAIKLLSVFFDFVLAFYVSKLVYLHSKNRDKQLLSFVVTLFVPTVILNSSFLGQCDAIYVSFVVASVYYTFKDKKILAVVLLSMAIATKLQAVFILPFYFVYMLRGHIKWDCFLMIPLVYIISIIPVWLVGRDFIDLLTIYVTQADTHKNFAAFFPNIYHWIQPLIETTNKGYSVVVAAIVVFLLSLELSRKKYRFSLESWFKLILLSVIILPFILPGILERYLYLGEIFAIIYVFLNYRKILVAISIIFISLYSYSYGIFFHALSKEYPMKFFSYLQVFSWKEVSILYLVVIIYLIYDFVKTLEKNTSEEDFVSIKL